VKSVAIQQPEHAPWIGFFHKMMNADFYVYLDSVQFKRRYFENRNKVREGAEWTWVTVPVASKGKYLQKICEVETQDEDGDWRRSYQGRLNTGLAKAPFKSLVMDWFNSVIMGGGHRRLVDLNMAFINFGRDSLGITTPTAFSSEMGVDDFKGKDLILEISRRAGASVYVSGPDGRSYLDAAEFERAGIGLAYHDFEHPEYTQWQGGFHSHMSFLDCLGNLGPEGMRKLLEGVPFPGK